MTLAEMVAQYRAQQAPQAAPQTQGLPTPQPTQQVPVSRLSGLSDMVRNGGAFGMMGGMMPYIFAAGAKHVGHPSPEQFLPQYGKMRNWF